MKTALCIVLLGLCAAGASGDPSAAAERARIPDDENSCIQCHAQLTEKDQERLLIDVKKFAGDSHWKKGLRCQDCHGGDATMFEVKAHQANDDFRVVKSPEDARAFCGKCHAPQAQQIAAGVHHQAGPKNKEGVGTPLACSACHGASSHDILSTRDDLFKTRSRESCSSSQCHKAQALEIDKSVHDAAGPKNKQGQATPLACGACHGPNSHDILPAREGPLKTRSLAFFELQEKTCGGCHEDDMKTYKASIHGQGLSKMGLLVVPVCADCHGSHGVYLANQQNSTLHSTRVAHTCGTCHRGIEERLQKSVHGRGSADDGVEAGGRATRTAPGGNNNRKPSCTDCHQKHDLLDPQSTTFRAQLPNRCGNCHANLSGRYAMSLHGALTTLGYGPAAKCSDCHGAHDILPVDDPNSLLAGDNRVETCKNCHVYANRNFSRFDPHADHRDPEANPILHAVFIGMELLLYSVFGFFGVHTLLWFARSLVHAIQHGRPKKLAPGQQAYLRFEPIHRVLHVIVIVSFLGLALTGLPLKYNNQDWAKTLALLMGGFDNTGTLHRFCALATIFYASTHLVWLGKKIAEMRGRGMPWKTIVFGPDSPVPNLRDVQDFWGMAGWFVGLKKKPVFERWSYWEKFDYWAVFWGVGIIGTTGLMLWFPNFFTRFLPGGILNGAKVIHSEEALLATGFIFAIHFFNTHLRAEKFPLDPVIFTGAISEEELREERPEYFERVRREGRLEQLRTAMPPRTQAWLIVLGGILALATGLTLLLGMMLAGLGH